MRQRLFLVFSLFSYFLWMFTISAQEKIEPKQVADSLPAKVLKEKTTGQPLSVKSPISPTKQTAELAAKYYRQGIVAYIQGDDRLALQYFKKTLELQPNHALAKARMEKLLQETDEKKIKKAKEKYNEGMAQYMEGKLEKAKALWSEALTLDPYNPKIQKALERLRAELRETTIP